jgi:membrane associated rhomboid family serine protease
MATLASCHAMARPRVLALARRFSRAAPRRGVLSRRVAATTPEDGETPRKEGTLSALDAILGKQTEEDTDTAPRTPSDIIEDYLTIDETGDHDTSKATAAPASTSVDGDDQPPIGWQPWFSPQSPVYEVPCSAPSAAYLLALAHLLVFFTDYYAYKAGVGNGGDLFLKLALVDDALITGNQWLRPWSACVTDYGFVEFLVATTALVTIGAEIEALLGTAMFVVIYVCTSAVGVLSVCAFDANTNLSVGGSDAIFGVFGAVAAYSAINAEPEWNPNGVAYRALQMLAFGTGLAWIAGLPTLGNEHVVSNMGHSVSFSVGVAMAYFGGAPLFVSRPDGDEETERKTTETAGKYSHSPHSTSLIAHTRTRRDGYLCPDCLSIHRDIQD